MTHFYLALVHHLRGETKAVQQQLMALLTQVELIQSPALVPLATSHITGKWAAHLCAAYFADLSRDSIGG